MRAVVFIPRLELYHAARIRALQRAAKRPPVLDVRVCEVTSAPLAHPVVARSGSADVAVETLSLELDSEPQRVRRQRVIERLNVLDPDCILVTGYSLPEMRVAMRWSRDFKRGCVLFCESQEKDHRRHWIKEKLKGFWLQKHVDTAVAGGAASAFYLESLGIPASRIWRGYDAADTTSLGERVKAIRRREAIERDRFLYVGRLVPEKNVRTLLRGFAGYVEHALSTPWPLRVVGDGHERAALEREVNALAISHLVEWTGYCPPAKIAEHYGASSALVLPSTSEPWGLVVNEAYAAGLPAIVSSRVGAAYDLVRPGLTGLIVDPSKPKAWTEAMSRLAAMPERDRYAMGERGRNLVTCYSPESWALVVKDAALAAMRLSNG